MSKCKENPSQQGHSETLQSHLCTLLTVISCLFSGSSWGQLLGGQLQLQESKFGGRCHLESGAEELRLYLLEHFMANTLSVSSGIDPVLLCVSLCHLPLQTNPLP